MTGITFLRVNSRDKGSWFVTVHPPNFRFALSLSLSFARSRIRSGQFACTRGFRSRGRAIRRSYVQMTRILNAGGQKRGACVTVNTTFSDFSRCESPLEVYRGAERRGRKTKEKRRRKEKVGWLVGRSVGRSVVHLGDRKEEEERKDRGEYTRW